MNNKVELELFLSNEDLESGDGLIGKYVVNIGFFIQQATGQRQPIAINKKFLLHNEVLFSIFFTPLKKRLQN